MAVCDHGCGFEATVEHADGRLLCRACYAAEVGNESWAVPNCPTCGPSPAPAPTTKGSDD